MMNNPIDFYNIFALMGENSLSDEAKNGFLDEIDNIILREFIYRQVASIKDKEVIKGLFEVLKKDHNTAVSIDYLTSKIPDFRNLASEFTRKKKKEFIIDHFENIINELKNRILTTKDNERSYHMMLETKFYQDAIAYAVEENWLELIRFFTKKNKLI